METPEDLAVPDSRDVLEQLVSREVQVALAGLEDRDSQAGLDQRASQEVPEGLVLAGSLVIKDQQDFRGHKDLLVGLEAQVCRCISEFIS